VNGGEGGGAGYGYLLMAGLRLTRRNANPGSARSRSRNAEHARAALLAALPERVLLPAVLAGIALVLLTPLVWSPVAWHPFSVGKAVYARSLIAVLFALWTLLALARPNYRPPPTLVLFALLSGLAVAAISGAVGVSPQRSLWSTYTRMEGLVDAASRTGPGRGRGSAAPPRRRRPGRPPDCR